MKCLHEKCQIRYRKIVRYKYITNRTYSVQTEIKRFDVSVDKFIKLSKNGVITISKGYAWDGPSGPTFDTRNFMRGSLVHNSFYQLIRERLLPKSTRKAVDKLLIRILEEEGMKKFRRTYVYWGVRFGGFFSVLFKRKDKKEFCA